VRQLFGGFKGFLQCDRLLRWSRASATIELRRGSRRGQVRCASPTFHSPDRYAAMPFQYVSGHSITQRTPAELLADVSVGYAAPPH
jgi:hypothetical protein